MTARKESLVRYEHTVTENGQRIFRFETWVSEEKAEAILESARKRGFVDVPDDLKSKEEEEEEEERA